MKKLAYLFVMMAAMSLGFVSCSDDDKDSGGSSMEKGSIVLINNLYDKGPVSIKKVKIYNKEYDKTYYPTIVYHSNKEFTDIPSGTYSVIVSTLTKNNYASKSGIRVKQGEKTIASFRN
ncbi:MAG: hypothetical protein LBR81_00640 [Prevotellaceae bacterium]|jgi:hypothetical protein|nr:hypothetical protein [Prevotellaceae bacterium]